MGTESGALTFPEAIQKIIDGGRYTKREWNDPAIFIFLHGGFLKIKGKDGNLSPLLISEPDMLGTDWVSIDN
jgi:hypothetical protein